MMIKFTIPGPPKGKARPKVTRAKNGASITYTPDATVAYEELVRSRYITASNGVKFLGDTPLKMIIEAVFPIPKSKSNRIKSEMLAGWIVPTKKPDCDNIIKIICDALNGIAYGDDAQIVDVSIRKIYGSEPRVEVRICG
ncbi:MAG: RusA family crossover junction endodeoxyribonuclease [Clostridiales bacterium]|jgi:Holliday junction resolvase RusA-like endonuclease|nr:RusA family crossover junction endodeoxyribonuclease [Clostridiales bacterium]